MWNNKYAKMHLNNLPICTTSTTKRCVQFVYVTDLVLHSKMCGKEPAYSSS